MTWLVYSVAVFGWTNTFMANTAVSDAAHLSASGNLLKICGNIGDTLIPHYFRPRPLFVAEMMEQPNPLGRIRDYWFVPLQVNFPAAIGTLSPLLIPWCLWRLWSFGGRRLPAAFWPAFFGGGFLLGVAVNGGRDDCGVAHICLQPLVLVAAAAMAAAAVRMPGIWRVLFCGGMAFDAAVGVWVHFVVQNLPVELVTLRSTGGDEMLAVRKCGLSEYAATSAIVKHTYQLEYLHDVIGIYGASACLFCAILIGVGSVATFAWSLHHSTAHVSSHSSFDHPPSDVTSIPFAEDRG